MSGRTFSRRFREHVGMTPAAWIARLRVREAQRLLQTTTLSVEAVAERAGYGSAAIMRERFSAFVGVSPLAYRRTSSSAGGGGSFGVRTTGADRREVAWR